jgi:hypothetical protein
VARQSNHYEKEILSIYREVLGGTEISPTDNFFVLGGDSLLATQILLKLQQFKAVDPHIGQRAEQGVNVSLRTIFDYPTVRDLTRWLKRTQRNQI